MFNPLKFIAIYSDPRFWVYAGTELAKASPILVQAYAFFLNWINSHNHYGGLPKKSSGTKFLRHVFTDFRRYMWKSFSTYALTRLL
jgi:hypothetical protein